jgi:hypothetical protein
MSHISAMIPEPSMYIDGKRVGYLKEYICCPSWEQAEEEKAMGRWPSSKKERD